MPPYNQVAIAPLDCVSESWRRIRDQYWLFVGFAAVGLLLGGMVPFGILLGPMMCGIYGCYRDKWQGVPVRFEGLFQGFDFFVPSLIATLITMGIGLVVAMPFVLIGVIAVVVAAATSASGEPSGLHGVIMVASIFGAILLSVLVSVLAGTLLAFAFPLIVDKRLDGLEAVKQSVRAALANVWGMLGLALLTALLGVCGACCCYVGAFLVAPVTLGAFMVAYERVFGLSPRADLV
jgi:hypothetical protein